MEENKEIFIYTYANRQKNSRKFVKLSLKQEKKVPDKLPFNTVTVTVLSLQFYISLNNKVVNIFFLVY